MTSKSGPSWPSVGKKDADHRIHGQNLLKEARLLKAFSTHGLKRKTAIPSGTALGFLDSVITYFDAPEAQEGQDALWKAVQQLQLDIKAQHKQQTASIHKLLSKGSNSPVQSPEREQDSNQLQQQKTWATVVGRGSYTNVSSTSTAKASQLNSLTTREIRLAINSEKTKELLRAQQKPSEHIVKQANIAITKVLGECTSHNHNNGGRTTATTTATATKPQWVESARLMNSGDVFMYATDAVAAERMIHRGREWQTLLGEGVEVMVPTWGVVVSNIPIRSIDMNNQDKTIDTLYSNNPNIIGGRDQIKRVTWLSKPKQGKSHNAIVMDLYSKEIANKCIAARKLVWEGAPKSTQQYSRKAQICQCFNCYGFDHTARMRRAETRCGFCGSKAHKTKEHPNPDHRVSHKCSNCKGPHPAFSRDCKSHKKAAERVKEERKRLNTEPLFPTTPVLTPSVSARGSRASTPPQSPEDTAMEGGVTIDICTPEAPPTRKENLPPLPDSDDLDLQPAEREVPLFHRVTNGPWKPAEPFQTPTEMEGIFGTANLPKRRQFKSLTRKLQSSPLKPREDGNTSDGYTIVGGKGKRTPKSNHKDSLSSTKIQRITLSGRKKTLDEEIDTLIHESATVDNANPVGTGSGPETDHTSSEVSTNSSSSSSAPSSSSDSSAGVTTRKQALAARK